APRAPAPLGPLHHHLLGAGTQRNRPSDPLYYAPPIFRRQDGKSPCRYIRGQIVNAQRFPEVPRFTLAQIEALDLLDAVTNDERFHITYEFKPGDVQLLNNHVCFHARTAFEDYPHPQPPRHLFLISLSRPTSTPL